MRKLAAALGVNPMSLYHHVENKAALLAGVTRMVVADVQLNPVDGTWQERLRRHAYEFRALITAHRDLMRHALAGPDFIQRDGLLWRTLCRILTDAGLPVDEVDAVAAVLAGLVGGLLLTDADGTLFRLSDVDPDAGFALAVDLLVAGVAARVAA
jgi:AcrR family transcriptional regulator